MADIDLYKNFAYEYEHLCIEEEEKLLKTGIDSSHEKYADLLNLHTARLKAIQREQHFLMETTYDMGWNIDSATPASSHIQFVIGKSGYARFGEVLKIKITGGSVIPFTHDEWREFSEKLIIYNRQCFEEQVQVDVSLFIDGLSIKSCQLDEKLCLKISRCEGAMYFDENMLNLILKSVEMINCRLQMLSRINFYDFYKSLLIKAWENSYSFNYDLTDPMDLLCESIKKPLTEMDEEDLCMLECWQYKKDLISFHFEKIDSADYDLDYDLVW